ncbi:MAG: hypothetical protein V3W41_10165 [Planctomycetota bacterium]
MWNEAARPFLKSSQLVVLGVVQEQHAERARLYAQWRQYSWPLAQDAVTSLNLASVPIAILIDEHGVVRSRKPRPSGLAEFVNTKFEAPKKPTKSKKFRAEFSDRTVSKVVAAGDKSLMWGQDDAALNDAIKSYARALRQASGRGKILFRLGVAYRTRFDSAGAQPGDFGKAVKNWTAALGADPNQYIWRRRIQQYGPRQNKPYPFYDWVDPAIAEIKARGETAIELRVALSGAETAPPFRKFVMAASDSIEPDPKGRVTRDEGLIAMTWTVVPAKVKAGQPVRVHIRMTPVQGKWNNEGDPLRIWIAKNSIGMTSQRQIEFKNPKEAESDETRVLEFEFSTPARVHKCVIKGYALYHTCVNKDGRCVYRRQDFSMEVPLLPR